MYIPREIDCFLDKRMFGGKVIVVYGPRQSGKTTAIEHYLDTMTPRGDYLCLNGDETQDRDLLNGASVEKLRMLMGNKRILFIDEAQKIPSIGLTVKKFHDQVKDVQIILSGSSSEQLAEKTEEPLTGRKFEFVLMPLTTRELVAMSSPVEEMKRLERRMVFGCYPDVVANPGDEVDRIRSIGKGYLYKDILAHEEIKHPEVLDRMLKALAYQIGQEASVRELAQVAGADPKTVGRYMDILEKGFVIFRLASFSRNLRNELKKSRKVYFCDLGIRNYVLGDWRMLSQRSGDDVGHMWENYFIAERRKRLRVDSKDTRLYFWRTLQRQEVDLIEESVETLSAFEIKWNAKKAKGRFSLSFSNAYPQASYGFISPANYFERLI